MAGCYRLIASDTHGVVNVWDKRKSPLPSLELITGSRSTLNTIQLHVDNQTIFGASKDGNIYMWDLRGGRTAAAFQCHNEDVTFKIEFSLPLAMADLGGFVSPFSLLEV
ncbi:hypothetical protein Gotri_016504, partial [Gossypium trilobum]|nr:hypothetical protein [Gossypium trilobum]